MEEKDSSEKLVFTTLEVKRRRDPYYIHPSDNSGSPIAVNLLTLGNFLIWNRSIRIALKTKNKLGFIEGTCLPPEDMTSEDFQRWSDADSLVIGWILHSMTKDLMEAYMFAPSARDLWLELEDKFGAFTAKQSGKSLSEYYGELVEIFRELDHRDKIRGEILRKEPVPNLEESYGLVRREAVRRATLNVEEFLTLESSGAKKCMMIGYAADSKAYKLFDLSTEEVFISRDVQFHESVFPLHGSHIGNGNLAVPIPLASVDQRKMDSVDLSDIEVTDLTPDVVNDSVVDETEVEEVDSIIVHVTPATNGSSSLHSSPNSVPSTTFVPHVVSPTPEAPIRRSTRERQPPTWLKNYVNFAVPSSSSYTSQAFPYTKPNCFSDSYMVFLANMSQVQDPTTYAQAKGSVFVKLDCTE
ncbi:Retrovirus-related Pol polyprotein from transposon RE2 [Senna tora]|uniref:Retrovirus-related Pol polyprotein from transposon RE2 n=1 Tax=Senna tora TaxID=362788 RepID=A0A834XHQ3_9FABA|nr:Retrovirus-related Pol polyprotein from transposon RE2 [Senna tora]